MGFFEIGELREQIELSNRFCARVSRNFESDVKIYKHEFEMIQADYLKVVESARKQFALFEYLKKIYFDIETSEGNFSEGGKMSNLPKAVEMNMVIAEGTNPAVSGLGAGLGVGAGVVGLMAAFGHAGTGAAIASLAGAAKVSALLAALGGGTLASGGLGMTGGIMVLGATVFLPAIAVAGYLAFDQVKTAHKKAIAQKAKARRLEAESKIYFENLDKGIRILREINYGFRTSAELFQRLMKISLTAPEIGYDEDYRKILIETAQVMKSYGLLKVLDENNKLNDKLDEEFSAARKSYETCFEHFVEFRTKISPQTLELVEQLKNSEVQPLKDEEIRKLFDEAITSAKKELDITAMKLNRFTLEYIPQFKALLDNGVTIKIFYGIGKENDSENYWTNETAKHLKKIFQDYPNFRIKRTDTHAKIFICDNKFYVLSSYNVLSKDGKKWTFSEAGIRSSMPKLIDHHRKEYFDF